MSALANTPWDNATMVWKDEASWNRASTMLMNKTVPSQAVIPLSSCTVRNGTRLGLVDVSSDNGAVVVVLNGPEAGCRGYVSAMLMSGYRRE